MIKKNKIKIKVNGKFLRMNSDSSINDMINKFNLPIKKVAIELNKKIIDKKKIKKTYLKNNDEIEIVHFIGGG